MNRFIAFAFLQFLVYGIFPPSHVLKFKVLVFNFFDEKTTIGILWPKQKEEMVVFREKTKFSFTLKKGQELTVKGQIQFPPKERDEKDGAEEFVVFTEKDFPAKMDLVGDSTLEIYYAVKENGLYLWDYKSHLEYIRDHHLISIPRDEHLDMKHQWKNLKV